jgi:hypothetical protein
MRNICSYFNNIYPDVFNVHIEEIIQAGFDTIVLCIPDDILRWNLENIKEIVRIAVSRKVNVWADPWGVSQIFDGEALTSYTHLSCLDNYSLKKHVHVWLDKVLEIEGIEAIFWDNPKTKCRKCEIDKNIVGFIRELSSKAKSSFLKNYICMSALETSDELFEQIASIESIDGIGTDPYCLGKRVNFNMRDYVLEHATKIKRLAEKHNKESHIWIQGFNIYEGDEGLPLEAMKGALAIDLDGIAFWGFRACEAISSIRPKNYKKVWELYINVNRKLKVL